MKWDSVIQRYGIANRSGMDMSQGVEKIITEIGNECAGVEVGYDLRYHFEGNPLAYIFVNSKNIPVNPEKADGFFNDALTECELTFYKDSENNLRFRYFIQLTHGELIHGLSWVRSEEGKDSCSRAFSAVRRYVEEKFISLYSSDCKKGKYGIRNGHKIRVGTMYYHNIDGFSKDVRLNEESIAKIVELISAAYAFFKTNEGTIKNMIK